MGLKRDVYCQLTGYPVFKFDSNSLLIQLYPFEMKILARMLRKHINDLIALYVTTVFFEAFNIVARKYNLREALIFCILLC
jgi:hypothetical protein